MIGSTPGAAPPAWHSHVLLHLRVVEAAADEALGGVEGVVGVGDSLALGWHPHQALALGRERHHRRRGAGSLRVLQHLGTRQGSHARTHLGDTPRVTPLCTHFRLLPFHNGHAGVGGAQVNPNNGTFDCF